MKIRKENGFLVCFVRAEGRESCRRREEAPYSSVRVEFNRRSFPKQIWVKQFLATRLSCWSIPGNHEFEILQTKKNLELHQSMTLVHSLHMKISTENQAWWEILAPGAPFLSLRFPQLLPRVHLMQDSQDRAGLVDCCQCEMHRTPQAFASLISTIWSNTAASPQTPPTAVLILTAVFPTLQPLRSIWVNMELHGQTPLQSRCSKF